MNMRKLMALAAICVAAASPSLAGLVAKWDFDNYDSENPTSAAILTPTVGTLAAIVATGNGSSTPVAAGTLDAVEVMAPEATGLKAGDYALKIPKGTHLKFPLPSGIVRDKRWMVRMRFYSPSASAGKVRTLLQPNWDNNTAAYWTVNENNIIYGPASFFRPSDGMEDDAAGKVNNKTVQANYRRADAGAWHSFAAYFCENGTATTLNGYRAVCDYEAKDLRTTCTRSGVTVEGFNGDGFIIGGADADAGDNEIWVASVEVWDGIPMFHSGGFVPTSTSACFTSCNVATLKDLYISGIFAGGWAGSIYTGVPTQAFERYIPQDGSFMRCNITGSGVLLDSTKTQQGTKCVLPQFTPNGSDLNVYYWKGGSGGTYHQKIDGSTGNALGTVIADNQRSTSLTGGAYSMFNLYALPLIPIADDLPWTYLMGYTSFGNPVLTIGETEKTVTFDAAPQVDSLTLDSSRGDGNAAVRFAYASDALKTMSSFGDLVVHENVTLTIPAGVSITGSLTLERKASLVVNSDGMSLANRAVVFTAAEGISIPAGVAIEDVATIVGGTLALSTDGTQLIFLENSTVPVTATWVGLGDRDDVLDPLNWQCLNANGTVLDGVLPTEETAITISGETTFNLPADQASRLQYRSLVISSCSLAADCDWRGFGASTPYAASTTIDLKGYKFYTDDVTSSVVVTNSLSGEPGECHLEFDVKKTVTGLNMTGNVRLVKEGTAELVLNYTAKQTYTGGTEIRAGRIGSTLDATQKTQFGQSGSEIIVRSGATLYPYNHDNWLTLYPIVLDGGSIYTWWSSANGLVIGSMRLLANSSLDAYSGGKLHVWGGHTVTLNGHTLVLIGAGEKCFGISGGSSVTFTEGVVDLQGGTMAVAGVVNAVNTTFYVGGALNIGSTLNVSNYVARYTGTSNAGTGAMNVYGTFKDESGKFYGCTMQNGSTIDLSGRVDAQPATSAFTAGNNKMSFASGAAVTLYLGAREVADGDKLIDWDEDIGTLTTTFAMKFADGTDTAEQRELVLELRPNGVYVKSTATPDYAIWDVEGNRWRFYKNDVEMPWDGGVGESIQVRFSTLAEYVGLLTNNVTPSAYVLTTNHFTNAAGATMDLVDGLRFFFDAGTVFDVNGGTLKMPASLTDGGAKAFTVTSSAEGGVFEINVPEGDTMRNTGMALTGSLKFVKSGPGVFDAAKAGQSYTGGTEATAGVLRSTLNGDSPSPFGSKTVGEKTITVRNAAFEMNNTWYTLYRLILDNGVLSTTYVGDTKDEYSEGAIFGSSELLSDSEWRTVSGGKLRIWLGHTTKLNGHKLNVNLENAYAPFIIGTQNTPNAVINFDDGTLVCSGGVVRVYNNFAGTINATNVTLVMQSALNMYGTANSKFNVRDYVAQYSGNGNAGSGPLNVFGTFKPSAHDVFYGCTMQSGSTIDLSLRTKALPLASQYQSGDYTLKFADNSTVYINAGNLKVGSKSPVITWDEKPANIRTVKFKNADPESTRTFVSRDDGVYALTGFVILIK